MGAAPELGSIDWSRPWLAPWRDPGLALAEKARSLGVVGALNQGLVDRPVTLHAGSLRFVDASELPRGEPYESYIARTARVPTRSNPHDFLNGLAWLRQPEIKRHLNEMQAEALALSAPGAPRGRVRDAATLFDENGGLLEAPEALVQALTRRDWKALFVTHRGAWREARLELFGHALIEKLMQPRKAITAHVWLTKPGSRRSTAECFARGVADPGRANQVFLPLPVLGVPGWWPANEEAAFYDDEQVFRPPRLP